MAPVHHHGQPASCLHTFTRWWLQPHRSDPILRHVQTSYSYLCFGLQYLVFKLSDDTYGGIAATGHLEAAHSRSMLSAHHYGQPASCLRLFTWWRLQPHRSGPAPCHVPASLSYLYFGLQYLVLKFPDDIYGVIADFGRQGNAHSQLTSPAHHYSEPACCHHLPARWRLQPHRSGAEP